MVEIAYDRDISTHFTHFSDTKIAVLSLENVRKLSKIILFI